MPHLREKALKSCANPRCFAAAEHKSRLCYSCDVKRDAAILFVILGIATLGLVVFAVRFT